MSFIPEYSPESAVDDLDGEFSLSFPLTLDEDEAQLGFYASDSDDDSTELEPREFIADYAKAARLQAQLKRPLYIGTIDDHPAMLLVFKFTFHRQHTGSGYRIKQAEIKLEFKDAPVDVKTRKPSQSPLIKDFEPQNYMGPVSKEQIQRSLSLKTSLADGIDAEFTKSTTSPREGWLSIQGLKSPGNRLVTWTILENDVLKSGIPSELVCPVLIHFKSTRRFSVDVSVTARLGWSLSGVLKSAPVLGSCDRPLYFDLAQLKERLLKGDNVARTAGDLTGSLSHLAGFVL